jgi:hypothetical protein
MQDYQTCDEGRFKIKKRPFHSLDQFRLIFWRRGREATRLHNFLFVPEPVPISPLRTESFIHAGEER